MNKGLFFSILLISIYLLTISCKKKPVYPTTPEIEFKSIEKYTIIDTSNVATLVVKININFKDGDGDLGLDPTELSAPYNEFDFVPNGISKYTFVSGGQDVNCKRHLLDKAFDADTLVDTVLIEPNLYYNNFIVEIYVKQPDKSFSLYNTENVCPDFNQRFPILNPLDESGPISGNLSHTIKDLDDGFSGKTIKFKAYIIDRALNKSNAIETSEILID